MRLMPFVITLAVTSVTGSLLFAAEPSKPVPAQTQPAARTGSQAASKTPAAKDADKAAPAADAADAANGNEAPAHSPAGKSAADKSSPQRFIPSEQVRADFDVSFPVDF